MKKEQDFITKEGSTENKKITVSYWDKPTPETKTSFITAVNAVYCAGGRLPSFRFWKRKSKH